MNAPLQNHTLHAEPNHETRLREIPYNYSSFSDRKTCNGLINVKQLILAKLYRYLRRWSQLSTD
jgi:hypothetical protein